MRAAAGKSVPERLLGRWRWLRSFVWVHIPNPEAALCFDAIATLPRRAAAPWFAGVKGSWIRSVASGVCATPRLLSGDWGLFDGAHAPNPGEIVFIPGLYGRRPPDGSTKRFLGRDKNGDLRLFNENPAYVFTAPGDLPMLRLVAVIPRDKVESRPATGGPAGERRRLVRLFPAGADAAPPRPSRFLAVLKPFAGPLSAMLPNTRFLWFDRAPPGERRSRAVWFNHLVGGSIAAPAPCAWTLPPIAAGDRLALDRDNAPNPAELVLTQTGPDSPPQIARYLGRGDAGCARLYRESTPHDFTVPAEAPLVRILAVLPGEGAPL